MASATRVQSKPRERLLNRELSWLDFNARVLELAADESIPLLERVKFVAIFSANLDEFFMVRVAGLMDQSASGLNGRSPRSASGSSTSSPSSPASGTESFAPLSTQKESISGESPSAMPKRGQSSSAVSRLTSTPC